MTNVKHAVLVLSVLVPTLFSALPARAYELHREYPRREVHVRPAPVWHAGHWVHDRHGGRLGWWWVVGPTWNFYPRPFFHPTVVIESAPVVVQQPPQVVVQQAPPQVVTPATPQPEPVLYYCRATGTNYPETMTCPGGWTTVTATTPPQP